MYIKCYISDLKLMFSLYCYRDIKNIASEAIDASPIYAIVDYSDDRQYVEPLINKVLQNQIPGVRIIKDHQELPSPTTALLTWSSYESLDFENLLSNPTTSLFNAYIIRKALIRKHYLLNTVQSYITKHPQSCLVKSVPISVAFEVDYAEFLDESLVEEYELLESMQKNEEKEKKDREYWILKPGMSDRGMGIRIFSTMEELQDIFEEFEEEEEEEEQEEDDDEDTSKSSETNKTKNEHNENNLNSSTNIVTSQLRHFVAQQYIEPLLLLSLTNLSLTRTKFHIRTYVLSLGALSIYVYKPMLALFSSKSYTPFYTQTDSQHDLSAHLTNTCLQTGLHDGSVRLFWSLGDDFDISKQQMDKIFNDICEITGELFKAAVSGGRIYFQPLPNAFEIFGLDFLVGGDERVRLLEVNAFPDFKQTGDELKGLVEGLFEGVVEVGVKGFFGIIGEEQSDMVKVLDMDVGKF